LSRATSSPRSREVPMTRNMDATVEQPKRFRRLLTLTLAAVLLAGAGGAGYAMLTGGFGGDEPAEPQPGAVITMDAITVNLADGHYLKMRLALQATKGPDPAPHGAKAHHPPIPTDPGKG